MKRRLFLMMGTSALVSGALTACGGGTEPAAPPFDPAPPRQKVVLAWNQAALQAVRVTRPGPPMAARSLALLHTAMYDAWAAFDGVAVSVRGGAGGRRAPAQRNVADQQKAMSFAAYAALLDQYPSQKAAFDAHMLALGLDPAQASTDPATAPGAGTLAAHAVLAHFHADGANQLGTMTPGGAPYADYTGYTPKNPPLAVDEPTPLAAIPEPGHWQPLSYRDAGGVLRTQGYAAASWHLVKPFALASGSQFRPPAPEAPGTPAFLAQAQHLVDLLANLDGQQKAVSEYWSDGPSSELPPGHWCLFAQFVSQRDGHGDDQDVKLFFALSNALFDAGIASWDAKRAFDSVRPVTAIRYLMHGKTITGYGPGGPAAGLRQIAGESWNPYQSTTFPCPPFAEHVSGHSTFSAAAAEVLARFTGSDAFGASHTARARSLQLDPALPLEDVVLSWPTFSAAAAEAGLSRLYGGIHFERANEDGQQLGRQVGGAAFARAQQFWQGRA